LGPQVARDSDKIPEHPSSYYFLKHMDELEVFQILEDDFNCSGMCIKGIFYFNNPLHYGAPEETCLLHFKRALEKEAKPLAVSSILVGTLCLILSLMHFCMYYRPMPQSPDEEQEDNGMPTNVPMNLNPREYDSSAHLHKLAADLSDSKALPSNQIEVSEIKLDVFNQHSSSPQENEIGSFYRTGDFGVHGDKEQ